MSKQTYKYLLGIVGLLFAAIIYFVWMPFPKGILLSWGSEQFVWDVVTTVLYYALFTLFWTKIIADLSLFTYKYAIKEFWKKYAWSLLGIAASTLLLDAIQLLCSNLLGLYSIMTDELLTVLKWIALGIITFFVWNRQGMFLGKGKRVIWICLGVLAVLIIVFVAVDMIDVHKMQHLSRKYSTDSQQWLFTAKNIAFLHSLRNTVLDCLSGIVTWTVFYWLLKNKGESERLKKVTFMIAMIGAAMLSGIICGIKIAVLPHSSLGNMNLRSSVSSHFATEEYFNMDSSIFKLSRRTGYGSSESVYCTTKGEIWYGDKKLYSFLVDGLMPANTYEMQGNTMIMNEALETFDVQGMEVKLCANQSMMYVDQGAPCCIALNELAAQEQNEILTGFCKLIVSEGRVDCFEYVCPYLKKYDHSFIEPYLQRYAQGDFTKEELANSQGVNPDYIMDIAIHS